MGAAAIAAVALNTADSGTMALRTMDMADRGGHGSDGGCGTEGVPAHGGRKWMVWTGGIHTLPPSSSADASQRDLRRNAFSASSHSWGLNRTTAPRWYTGSVPSCTQ